MKNDFQQFVETANAELFEQICEWIYSRNAARFNEYLPDDKDSDGNAVLFKTIDLLPIVTLRRIIRYKDFILKREVIRPSSRIEEVISTTIRFAIDYESPLDFSVADIGIHNSQIPDAARVKLAIYLSNQLNTNLDYFRGLYSFNRIFFSAFLNKSIEVDPISGLKELDKTFSLIDIKLHKGVVLKLLRQLKKLGSFNSDVFYSLKAFLHQSKSPTKEFIGSLLKWEEFNELTIALDESRHESDIINAEGVINEHIPYALLVVDRLAKGGDVAYDRQLNLKALAIALRYRVNISQHKRIERWYGNVLSQLDSAYGAEFHYHLSRQDLFYSSFSNVLKYGHDDEKIWSFVTSQDEFVESQKRIESAKVRTKKLAQFA